MELDSVPALAARGAVPSTEEAHDVGCPIVLVLYSSRIEVPNAVIPKFSSTWWLPQLSSFFSFIRFILFHEDT